MAAPRKSPGKAAFPGELRPTGGPEAGLAPKPRKARAKTAGQRSRPARRAGPGPRRQNSRPGAGSPRPWPAPPKTVPLAQASLRPARGQRPGPRPGPALRPPSALGPAARPTAPTCRCRPAASAGPQRLPGGCRAARPKSVGRARRCPWRRPNPPGRPSAGRVWPRFPQPANTRPPSAAAGSWRPQQVQGL